MENKKTNNVVVCIICGVLTAFGLVAEVISIINSGNNIWTINSSIDLITTALIGYYAIYGYRKPHGNLLKYIILLYSVPFIISIYSRAQKADAWEVVIRSIIIGFLCYLAGRLDKVKQNALLMSVVTILLIVFKIINFTNVNISIRTFPSIIIWIDICVAYLLRYKEHKEAGLMDAPKN